MGEIIRILGTLPNGMKIELNKPTVRGGSPRVHIQDSKYRLDLSQNEFMQIALLFHDAKTKLIAYKEMPDDSKSNE